MDKKNDIDQTTEQPNVKYMTQEPQEIDTGNEIEKTSKMSVADKIYNEIIVDLQALQEEIRDGGFCRLAPHIIVAPCRRAQDALDQHI